MYHFGYNLYMGLVVVGRLNKKTLNEVVVGWKDLFILDKKWSSYPPRFTCYQAYGDIDE